MLRPVRALLCLTALAATWAGLSAGATAANGDGWTMPAGSYASTRFSSLDDIDTGNVSHLEPVLIFPTGVDRGHEAAPLVDGPTMYIVTPYPNIVFALDLTKPRAPLKWQFEPEPVPAAQGIACCGAVNRGAMLANGRLYFNTLDGRTMALDAETGELLWRTTLGKMQVGETLTMAPLVVKDKVLVGVSGGEFGVRGWMAALDAGTGQVVWRAYHTGPDEDVLIGPEFEPFYDSERGRDLGVTTWPPEAWKTGGGTAWGWISYDPQLDLIYYGTANPAPWNPAQRPGDNKWTNGIFARDPDDGQVRWFYSVVPHDLYAHDAVNELILLDLPIDGVATPVIVRPERNGYLYVIDRRSGEVLSADPYWEHINAYRGIDLESGRLRTNPAKYPEAGKVVREICPAAPGVKSWNPSAYSPRTGLVYIPHLNLCMGWESLDANYIAGTPYVGANVKMYPGPGGHRGELTAWDPVERQAAWKIEEDLPLWSGALATAGDLVFYGTLDGWFKAVDARTGDLLWRYKAASGIVGQPITYRGPDGRQYVAVLAGVGGWAGSVAAAGLDVRDPTAARGFASAVPDLPSRTRPGGTLHVFAIES